MIDGLALFLLVLELWVPVYWLLVHPFAPFWRRQPRRWLSLLAAAVWLGGALALLWPYEWWLAERFLTAGWRIPVGLALAAGDIWVTTKVEREMGWRVMIGLPEVARLRQGSPGRAGYGGQAREAPEADDTPHRLSTPAVEGLYRWVRHPRYLGTVLAWLAAVALSGATRLAILVGVFFGLMFLMIEWEERELVARFGASYREYQRRTPRLLPLGGWWRRTDS